jgi:hypothetical protein
MGYQSEQSRKASEEFMHRPFSPEQLEALGSMLELPVVRESTGERLTPIKRDTDGASAKMRQAWGLK